MGKRRNPEGATNVPQSTKQLVSRNSVSIREEVTGKLQTTGGGRNPRSFLMLDHLRTLANWTTQVSILSLGAFFGRQAAAAAEVLAAPPDQDEVTCQRCETILQPGFNCTVRVEKVKEKPRKKPYKGRNSLKNNVVYKCHYCSHPNLKRGTPRGYLQGLCSPKEKPSLKHGPDKNILQENGTNNMMNLPVKEDVSLPDATRSCGSLLLDAKKRRRKSGSETGPARSSTVSGSTISASQKRRKKSWTSLKEMVETTGKETVPIPFIM